MSSNNCLTRDEKWEKNFNLVLEYFKSNGRLPLTSDRDNGGFWLKNQRSAFICNKLSSDRIDKLNSAIPNWLGKKEGRCSSYTWFVHLNTVKNYYKEYGKFPLTSDKENSGRWLSQQRQTYKYGKLLDERKEILDTELFGWNNVERGRTNNVKWDKYLVKVLYYHEKNNEFPNQKDSKNGGSWLMNQRLFLKNGKLTPERKKRLDFLLPGWDIKGDGRLNDNIWFKYLNIVVDYKNKNGVLPTAKDKENGGVWLANQRQIFRDGKLRSERLEILNREIPNWICFNHSDYGNDAWFINLEKVRSYVSCYNEFPLFNDKENGGRWLCNQRQALGKGTLKEERKCVLDEVLPGWSKLNDQTSRDEKWFKNLDVVVNYYNNFGEFPAVVDIDNNGLWLSNQKQALKNGKLRSDRKALLDEKLPGWNLFRKRVTKIESSNVVISKKEVVRERN